MFKTVLYTHVFILFCSVNLWGQRDSLRAQIQKRIAATKADVGVAMYHLHNNDTLSFSGNKHFPMQSVFKFHIGLAVLHKVDKKQLRLQQPIFIKKSQLTPNTWSPIREDYPQGNVNLTLAEVLTYTVSKSDNIGCDILLTLLGGTNAVERYLHSIGIRDISIKANEAEMHKHWDIQFKNWTTPEAATQALKRFYEKKLLSTTSHDFLWKIMAETPTGKKRLRGLLPAETVVVHKTGSSGKNAGGISAAVNDIGIITLPGGNHIALSVFVSNSPESDDINEKIIADIAKLVWDYYASKAK